MTHFTADFFAGNRQALLKELGSGALVVLTAHTSMQRNADIAFKFEQEANFWYMTGIDHPDWQVIIDGTNKAWLVAPQVDDVRDVFDGSLSRAEATRISGIKNIVDPIEAKRLLGRLRQEHPLVYTPTPQALAAHYGFHPNPAQRQLVESLGMFRVQDCRQELHRLRAIKQPNEIKAIQNAIDISIKGITHTLAGLKKLQYEYEVEAELGYHFRRFGAQGYAYDPIVASGKNACTLHYVNNDAALEKKDWLLFDVGARADHYCADITRTIPLSKPTKREVTIYEAVLRVHDAAIKLCQPGQAAAEYQKMVDEAMIKELYDLKLIKDDDELRTYFPHAVSHGLGIDVHDPLGKPMFFAEGMVLTVEPGIYVPEENIGIRIENNIHITADGPMNMSKKLPTDLGKLAALVKGA